MKKIDFNNKETTWWLIIILIIIILAILFTKRIKNVIPGGDNANSNNLVDIVNTEDYAKFSGTVETKFEGDRSVNFSFLHKKDIEAAKGDCGNTRCFTLTNSSGTNDVTLYFTYEGGRGMTVEDYADLLIKDNASGTIEDLKFATGASSSVKYVVNTETGFEYYVEGVTGVNGDPWLAIVENKEANNDASKIITKDLIRSFKVE